MLIIEETFCFLRKYMGPCRCKIFYCFLLDIITFGKGNNCLFGVLIKNTKIAVDGLNLIANKLKQYFNWILMGIKNSGVNIL